MDREKLYIPMPNEQMIHAQIEQIVASGMKQKQSFPSYLKSMVQQVGMRHLFSDRMELSFILITAIALLSGLLLMPEQIQTDKVYAFVFLVSPLLFLVFSIYSFANKTRNDTFEVEMACKYNVYQITAFRMLVFSVVSVVVNTLAIALIVMVSEDILFIRAFMISNTALFIFSILFLYALMKRRSTVIVAATIVGWTFGNLLLRFADNRLYSDILVDMPLVVYAVVLIGSLYLYMNYVKKLIHFKQTEGAF
ncbi:hypothetical protein [Sporosarcina limicola]|uniref:Membrane-associated HD superfamily phosphohydrolase n=1 Tax=Sporosarcina limicola TaxID=34101 RepID=A0A927R4K2_9BACL|nr:hypothetical protein [Sporosarcina limicola]MBE1554988.1 membrane-associated HD superfamily phosphohydrolase [Sporosarcina limicola]